MDDKKLQDFINRLEKLRQDTAITPSRLEDFLKLVLGVIKASKENFDKVSGENLGQVKKALDYITTEHTQLLSDVTKNNSQAIKEFDSRIAEIKNILEEVKAIESKPGEDGEDGKDGESPKIEDIVTLVLTRLPPPDEPEEIKNKLESLEGEDRLDASAIKNLPKPSLSRGGLSRATADILYQTLITVANSAPSNPILNQLWLDTS